MDKDGFELQIGDEFRDLNYNKIEGPITKIVTEITGSADESIKNIIYVNNKFYLLGNIEKIKKNWKKIESFGSMLFYWLVY